MVEYVRGAGAEELQKRILNEKKVVNSTLVRRRVAKWARSRIESVTTLIPWFVLEKE